MIRYRNVTKIYPDNSVALRDVSFDVQHGEFVSVVGKSGAGKTTLLKLLLAEERPTKGEVLFEELSVHQLRPSDLPQLRRNIGMVFQDYKLLNSKTAYENVAYVMEVMGLDEETIARDVQEVLEIVGLEDRVHHYPLQLSGGEKQRVAIARALIHRPRVIVADEPTGNLDPYHTRDIIRLLLRINELGTTVILATHNKEIVNRLERRVLTLVEGRLVRDEKQGKFIVV
ncbi:MAG: cell division ATP-binding protein FtsE [Candidatus Wildermuthbacteria bacterium RIFCSPLOWO2_02_FULL_47_9c]|uniref:Cell division ATP-binding protein FtsE n=2 Tax=Parcubacteria group TaxID=1794811 RepID=A0A837IL88_9BACT|nr:MAG: Cell division ATP-binding protein FtsE [Candidatus Yanofskybacteria bacterium GW2011_GWC1_48_11]KKW04152.1 MAG: Cell division ATP-binding protein FtsE [Parcubacteria group bacterium GW2011_GWB1_49_12]KKW08427.1 MAG: Cell division ATP-binding protein FtsE [Parcubacteria group bacterium GW2011_GWA1_49_26]OHA61200.1 MAG: cell division ATP-binding protein FtsE [Candidatus Wildermuthbacteria bacterium GWA1_49_26]OHA65683.1 MAG: cell division ATP-binding protein FtsE [Candidatus Wildermuthbac